MIIIDSCGWLEWFTDGKLADEYKEYLAAAYMKNYPVIPFDDTLAFAAADIALQEKTAMADAIIVATSRAHNCRIISSDVDLKDQVNVDYIPKK